MKKTLLLFVLAVTAFLQTHAQKSAIFCTDGKAIRGYDPVAFFKEHKAVQGTDSLSFKWNDATWLFSSRANMEAFKAAPDQYAPQYGGYCAYGTSMGHKAPTATDTWTIVNDKLYFNYNTKVKDMWVKDEPALIQKADQQWSQIKDKE